MKKIFKAAVVVVSVMLAVTAAVRFSPYKALKEIQSQKVSTRIYDANGELLQVLALEEGVRREFTPLEDIPQNVLDAFIQAEDKRFYKHHGIDVQAVFRAAKSNVSEGRTVSGASTITMQLARIISPRPVRNLRAKVVEAWNALRLESRLSKTQILELYMNNVPFGFNTEGVTSAARFFYGKTLFSLNEEQIETLAKIPRRPKAYADLAGNYHYPFELPHYINWLKTQNVGLYEVPEVHLKVSLAVQKKAESLLGSRTEQYADNRLSNGAVLALDVETGDVLVWAGSAAFDSEEHSGQIDGVLVQNQPGSSMKPFLYALALERGFKLTSVLPDIPMEFGFEELYVPQNFNNRYNGPIRFRVALASSLNIPAVYLLNEVGLEIYKNKLLDLGFESLRDQDTGLSLALGGGEVTLYELTKAFSVFPRDGKTFEGAQVYEPDTARIICNILSDSDARALGFGYAKVFQTSYDSMFKTGTANQFQNITALAASGRYVVGVWMGNFSGETIVGKTGSSIPAAIAREILDMLENDGKPDASFKEPVNYHKVKVCSVSGMKAGDFCKNTVYEYEPVSASAGTSGEACNWHRGSELIYPEKYASWFVLKNRQGTLDYGNEPLEITSPRDGSIFYFDESSGLKDFQKLTVSVMGGSEETCQIFVDGIFAGESFRPFIFRLPLSQGEHLLQVVSGEESDSISYIVN
ncbi:MAG: transglycosylase domain-containing protein [Treponema sp.]|nr:transglycosylase domain-containing protein [Treponema sp.]